jgi:hypothetical protein
MNLTGFIKLKLLSIDAWREPEGGWTWNDLRIVERDWYWSPESLKPRQLLRRLRKSGYLTDASKGRVRVEVVADDWHDGTLIEIQDKNTREPLLALSNLH